MILLSWNIRGLGAKIKRNILRKRIHSHEPSIIFIQETKLESLSQPLANSLGGGHDSNFCISPAHGSSGGLISLWRESTFHLRESRIERNWIAIEGTLKEFDCILINIYNSCDSGIRAATWENIQEFCLSSNLPCLVAGDFNEVLSSRDRGSNHFDEAGSSKFQEFVSNLHLIEITPSNGWFTWFRGQSKSKLDRIFVQSEWIAAFPSLKASILRRSVSDHCPLLLQSQSEDWGPRPFRFQNAWLTHKGCQKLIDDTWLNSGGLSLTEKLKRVKNELKSWNSHIFGNIDSSISRLEDTIQYWDNVANDRDLDPDEIITRSQAQLDLWGWLRRKKIHWAQNSRVNWLKLGDRNSKFFHTCASIRRRKNNISVLEIEGEKITDPEKIKKEAILFYRNLFSEKNRTRPFFSHLSFNQISETQANDLIAPFSHTEIDEAVASCNPSKSPGPDGFNFHFIKASWHSIKEDFYLMIHEFWQTGILPRGSNVAFIALIAKIETPSGFKDFRPISMVGCVYKVIAKLLARRLKRVMSDLVGPHQSSFIEGRQILDSAFIVGELLDSCKHSSKGSVMLKLDFHKAFDCVSWSFLDWTLEKMGFPLTWRKWISSCVTSAAASVILNGSPSMPFKLQRGLRQGDPLSPFLFILIAEVLSLMIKKATSLNLWSGIAVCKNGPLLTHLQFANDTIIFAAQDMEALTNIKKILILFELTSGLQINFHKSELLGINTSQFWLQEAAAKLHCKVGSFPIVYLGLPIGGTISRISLWDPLIEKMKKKLVSWKGKLLSIGGRITLLKASLSNLPIYYMSLYPLPQGVIDKIIKIQRNFIWSGGMDKRSLALVRWELLQLPKSLGGLNVSNLFFSQPGSAL